MGAKIIGESSSDNASSSAWGTSSSGGGGWDTGGSTWDTGAPSGEATDTSWGGGKGGWGTSSGWGASTDDTSNRGWGNTDGNAGGWGSGGGSTSKPETGSAWGQPTSSWEQPSSGSGWGQPAPSWEQSTSGGGVEKPQPVSHGTEGDQRARADGADKAKGRADAPASPRLDKRPSVKMTGTNQVPLGPKSKWGESSSGSRSVPRLDTNVSTTTSTAFHDKTSEYSSMPPPPATSHSIAESDTPLTPAVPLLPNPRPKRKREMPDEKYDAFKEYIKYARQS